LTEQELAHWAKVWQATVYRNRGPDFVAQARLGLRLIAEVERLRTEVERLKGNAGS
jgi:hypothetical protein